MSKWAGLCRLGGIGDNLIAASVLRPLKEAGYKTDVLSQEPQHVVFENNPFVDKLSIKKPGEMPSDNNMWQAWFRSRAGEYDRFVNLSHTCEFSLAILPAQTQATWPASMRRKYHGHNYLEYVHDAFEMPYTFGPMFFPTEEETTKAHELRQNLGPKKTIGWVLAGTRPDKLYPPAPMAISRLIKELDVNVIMFGATVQEFEMAQNTQMQVARQNGSEEGLSLAMSSKDNRNWPIRRILTQAQHCDLVIGPDTGPMWAVAMEPMPKIMMLSHASPNNITKHWVNTVTLYAAPEITCWPCHLLHDTLATCHWEQDRCGAKWDRSLPGAACITSISIETLIQTTRALLEEKSHGIGIQSRDTAYRRQPTVNGGATSSSGVPTGSRHRPDGNLPLAAAKTAGPTDGNARRHDHR